MATTTTDKLLATLAQSDVCPPEVLEELRRRVAKAPGPVDPRSVTKWLVQKKHITVEEALELLAGRAVNRSAPPVEEELEVVEDDLVLADDLEEVAEDDLVLIDDEPVPPPKKQKAEAKPAKSAPAKPAKTSKAAQPAAVGGGGAPLDNLLEDAVTGGLDPLSSPAATASMPGTMLGGPATVQRIGKKKKKNAWDSPLLMMGGGGLLLLLLVGGGLYWRLSQQDAEESFRLAEEAYEAGSYTQAIHRYDKFLELFPKDPKVSLARVHRGLAQMRQAVDGSSDFGKALATSQTILDDIAKENEFSQAHGELQALLPKLAENLSGRAVERPSQELVDQAEKAKNMVEKYVPKSMRPITKLQEVEQKIELTKIALARDASLAQTLVDIQTAADANKPGDAYAARNKLLKTYPDLAGDAKLNEVIRAVSQSEKKSVLMQNEPRSAEAAEAESAITSTTALVARTAGNVPGAQGKMVFVLADGAAYGIEAATGKVAWRRFVGFDTRTVPRPITAAGGVAALLFDSVRNDLLCVDAATGKLRWRLPIGEPCDAEPALLRTRAALATRSGRIVLVDLETGASPGHVRIPHRLSVSPTIDQRERRLYQIGAHSNLYVISAQNGQCEEVHYTAHEQGSVRVPPFAVSRYVLYAENTGVRESVLRVLLANDEGLELKPLQSIQLEGQVHAPLSMIGARSLLVATDRGAIYIFDVGTPDKKEPFTKVAQKGSTESQPIVRYCYGRGSELWVADTEFNKFNIQTAQARLAPAWNKYRGDTFLQPLEVVGDALVLARRKQGQPGVYVSAAAMSDGAPLWETAVGAPLAGSPVVDGQNVSALNLAGGFYRLPADLKEGVVECAAENRVDISPPIAADAASVPLSGEAIAFSPGSGSEQVVLYAPGVTAKPVFSTHLPYALATVPVAFQGNLLAATTAGPVVLLGPTGKSVVDPFQPKLESGVQYPWRAPALLGEKEIIITDGRNKIYRLARQEAPRPALVSLGEMEIAQPIVSPIAVLGETGYAVDASRHMTAFTVPSLEQGKTWNLNSQVAWGPARVADCVLLATANDQLYCFGPSQDLLWQKPLAYGPLAGAPAIDSGNLVLASKKGVVWTASAADGQEISKVDVAQPLGAGPVLSGGKVLLTSHDGSLLVIAKP